MNDTTYKCPDECTCANHSDGFQHLPPVLRVEAFIASTGNNGARQVFLMQQRGTGRLSLPGGAVATHLAPVEALRGYLSKLMGMKPYMIAEYRLLAVDSDIRPGLRQTKMVMVYHVVPTWPIAEYLKLMEPLSYSGVVVAAKEIQERLKDAPYLARRILACFNAVKHVNPALNLRGGNSV